jgi:hypothetical protein
MLFREMDLSCESNEKHIIAPVWKNADLFFFKQLIHIIANNL